MTHSSSGLGLQILSLVTGVRFPYGLPNAKVPFSGIVKALKIKDLAGVRTPAFFIISPEGKNSLKSLCLSVFD